MFHNVILVSPFIISPSQVYQVQPKETMLLEAAATLTDGEAEISVPGSGDIDIKGTELGLGAFFKPREDLVAGLMYENASDKFGPAKLKVNSISPHVAYSATANLSLGLAIDIRSGTQNTGARSLSISSNTAVLGVTYHEADLEGTLVVSTQNKDSDKPQNNVAQRIGLQGRYRVNPDMALGLSLVQAGYAALNDNSEDEMEISALLESKVAEDFNLEAAFRSTKNAAGSDGQNGASLEVLGVVLMDEDTEAGAGLQYLTEAGDLDYKATAVKLFISAQI